MSANCLFCKIAAKQIPSKIVYEDPDLFAFEDISPQAPTHILICPRKHFESLTDAAPEDQALLGKLQLVAAQLARERKLLEGYRTVLNSGSGAGQSVFHLHLHLLGGRQFRWPTLGLRSGKSRLSVSCHTTKILVTMHVYARPSESLNPLGHHLDSRRM